MTDTTATRTLQAPGQRELILDCETTGLHANEGDRMLEIAVIQLIDGKLGTQESGGVFHTLIDPERDVPEEAVRIHGIDNERLRQADAPKFKDIAASLLDFLAHDPLVIHNAEFDMGFLNAELERIGSPKIPLMRSIDTLHLARVAGFNARSLDALCKHYGIDLSGREKHNAIIDCVLLSKVYLKLISNTAHEQSEFALRPSAFTAAADNPLADGQVLEPRAHTASPEERAAHRRMLEDAIPNHRWPTP